jgi:hypothetical protein
MSLRDLVWALLMAGVVLALLHPSVASVVSELGGAIARLAGW